MFGTAPDWRFAGSISAERAAKLSGYQTFDAIANLVADAAITEFAWELFGETALRGCSRASFLLRVEPTTYDAFFNSPVGYRAQFAISVFEGEKANRYLLTLLESKLLAFASARKTVSESFVAASLHGAEAKLWIYEREVETQMGRENGEIEYLPWSTESEDGAGLLAPVGTMIEVKGAWLDSRGQVRHNLAKAHRSNEIHRTGYS